MDRRTIEIDFDVHKLIEAERKSFSESDNAVLRRLLKLGLETAVQKKAAAGRAWHDDGVTLSPGTEVRMTYNKRLYTGRIEDGQWFVEGGWYSSPSAAASGAAQTKAGEKTNLDGWKYWEVMLPGSDKWRPISKMRPPKIRLL